MEPGVLSTATSNKAGGSASQYNAPVTIYNGTPSGATPPNLEKRREELLSRIDLPQYVDPKDKIPYKVKNTGDWFLSSDEFHKWRDSESSRLLWLSADAGCGKSVLVKHLTENLSSGTVCYFFFEAEPDGSGGLINALRRILFQLFSQDNIPLPSKSQGLLNTKTTTPWHFEHLWQLLLQTAKQRGVGEIVCLLDAVDECGPEEWAVLSEALQRLYGSKECEAFNLKFLLTSQPYNRIHSRLRDLFNDPCGCAVHVRGECDPLRSKISHEIGIFVNSQIQSHAPHLGPDTRRLLRDAILSGAQMTYLRAHHTLSAIKRGLKVSRDRVAEVVWQLPGDLSNAYQRILRKSNDVGKATCVLQIVVAAAEPLTLGEMASVLATMSGDDGFDIDFENDFIIRETCGLVTVVDSTIRLIDDTVGMLQAQRLPVPGAQHRWHSPASHFTLAQCCIYHLLHPEFEKNPLGRDDSIEPYLQDHPFLRYAARHWMTHFRASNVEGQDAIASSVLALCNPTSARFLTWFRLYWENANPGKGKLPEGFTTLMAASYLGLPSSLINSLMQEGENPYTRDRTYNRSPLHWAALRGNADVVAALLGVVQTAILDSNPDEAPLTLARLNGHASTVRVFLERGDYLTLVNQGNWVPLESLLFRDFAATIRLILDEGHDTTFRNNKGWTLLHAAASCNDTEVLTLLLNKGIFLEATSVDGWTPLLTATRQRQVGAVKLLLQRGTAAGLGNGMGGRALRLAALCGYVDVLKAILDCDMSTTQVDRLEALDAAALCGQLDTFTFLLDAPTEPTSRILAGHRALIQAAGAGHEHIVALLLGRGFNPAFRGDNRYTALFVAAGNGHVGIVGRLLGSGASLEAGDEDGNTPLLVAANRGHEGVVRLLLAHGANAWHANNFGRTATQIAYAQGHHAIAQRLQQQMGGLVPTLQNAITLAASPLMAASSVGGGVVGDYRAVGHWNGS